VSGRLHRVVDKLYTRSPLSEPDYKKVIAFWSVLDDGEIHRRGEYILYSRSPLSETGLMCLIVLSVFIWFKMSGRFTGEEKNIFSFSPL